MSLLRVQMCLLLLAGTLFAQENDCLSRCPKRPGPFGSPELDKSCALQCLQGEDDGATPEKQSPEIPTAGPSTSYLRFTDAWKTATFQPQRAAVEQLFKSIPDGAFKSWARENIVFDRVSRGPLDFRAGIKPGRLHIYDPFWDPSFSDSGRINILVFELAKGLWFERINPGPVEAKPPRVLEFDRIYKQHARAIEAMPVATFDGEDLAFLTDKDPQSWFAYACRVEILNLSLPVKAPAGYSEQAWARIKHAWARAREDFRRYLASVLRARS